MLHFKKLTFLRDGYIYKKLKKYDISPDCKDNYTRVERELKVKLKRKSDVEATSDLVGSDDSLSKDTITQTQLISDNGSYSTACRKAIYV